MYFSSKTITVYDKGCATIFILFLFYSSMVGIGCGNVGTSESEIKQNTFKYFDLKGFIEKEAERLAERTSFTKTVFVNGEQETKPLSHIDAKAELMPFSSSDINKPAWSDQYEIDSVFNQNKELIGLRYQSKDKKLKTKKMSIDFQKSKVVKVYIENATESSVATTYQTLTYRPEKGFSIESRQDVSLMDENQFKIEVSFQ
ncbi:MAG: hypothetical protein R2788_14140 [Saprospiraceae bacterium]